MSVQHGRTEERKKKKKTHRIAVRSNLILNIVNGNRLVAPVEPGTRAGIIFTAAVAAEIRRGADVVAVNHGKLVVRLVQVGVLEGARLRLAHGRAELEAPGVVGGGAAGGGSGNDGEGKIGAMHFWWRMYSCWLVFILGV